MSRDDRDDDDRPRRSRRDRDDRDDRDERAERDRDRNRDRDRDDDRDDRDDDRPARRRSRRDDDEPQTKQTSVLGVLSLIQGVGSLIASFIPCIGAIGMVGGAIGLVLGGIGIIVAKKSERTGTGLPIAGTCVNLAAIVIGGAWLLFMTAAFKKDAGGGGGSEPDGTEITVASVALDKEFDDNVLAAEKKYKGKTVIVTGKIKKITRDDKPGKITVELAGTPPDSTVDCHFDRDKQTELNALALGQEVSIRGTCKGRVDEYVTVEKCALTQKPEPKKPDEKKPDAKTPDAGPIAVTAEALEREYDGNVLAADGKYKGKTLDLTGKMVRISRNKPGKVTVELSSEMGGTIECDFASKDAPPQLTTVAVDDELLIRGVCRGKVDDVVTLAATSVKKVDRTPTGPPVPVSAEDLGKAYEENVVAADGTYKGKLLEVTGKVLRVTKNKPGKITLELGTDERLWALCDFVAKDGQTQLGAVKAGDKVVIRGACRGNGEGVPTIENCSLVKK